MKISVVIITYNEEDRLADALASCRDVAEEILVCDSYSTDRTVAVAESGGARVIQHRFSDYGSQKNFAMEKAAHEWVLNLDADERLSRELKASILRVKREGESAASGFMISRRAFYLGRWIRHSGWYPDRKLRLFRRSQAHWEGRIHERLALEGTTNVLAGDILHFTYRDLADHVARINRYTDFQAVELIRKSERGLLAKALLLPPLTFLRHYVWRGGFRDGFAGLVIALLSAQGTALKYLKALERRRDGQAGHHPD